MFFGVKKSTPFIKPEVIIEGGGGDKLCQIKFGELEGRPDKVYGMQLVQHYAECNEYPLCILPPCQTRFNVGLTFRLNVLHVRQWT